MGSLEERLRGPWLAALGGDAAAYESSLRELAAMLRGYYRRRLASLPDEVEDLVQETLIAVHNQRHTYDPGQPLTAWVHAIAKYKFGIFGALLVIMMLFRPEGLIPSSRRKAEFAEGEGTATLYDVRT